MKKYSIAVCVCAVLFSVGIHGGGMREVFARAPGADENLAILQDIIRENECQAGMAFLGYTYEGAEAAEILEYTRQGEVAAAYPFLQDGTVVDAGGYEIYAIVPGDDCRVSVYPAQPTEEGEYLDDLNAPYYTGKENEIIILRCNVSEIHSNVMVSVQKQNMSIQYHPMVSLKDGHLAAETHCYDFSIYYNWDECDLGMIRNWISGLPENSFQKQMKSAITLVLGCLCGIQILRSTLREEIVRYLFWERITRIILQKNIIMQ